MAVRGATVQAFNGAHFTAPYVASSLGTHGQEAIGNFFGGNTTELFFQPQNGDVQGPTTAYSTTVEARRWDKVINCLLIMEKMHEHQMFAQVLAPLELAKGMEFITRTFTSNTEPPEEAPEHVPAPYSTTQWSETRSKLTMVHRGVKFSMHELKTAKGQQDYKVHLNNLAIAFVRDTNHMILRKFARQSTVLQSLVSFYPQNKKLHKELLHSTIRNFGMLNSQAAGLDALVCNVQQIGTTQGVEYDTCVVPYGSLSNLALNPNNFILSEITVPLARSLAAMADISHSATVPTHLFKNKYHVFQHMRTALEITAPHTDPLASVAVVATYHPFGNDIYMPGSRDIQVVSATSNGYITLKLSDAITHLSELDISFTKTEGNALPELVNGKYFGQQQELVETQILYRILENIKRSFPGDKGHDNFKTFVLNQLFLNGKGNAAIVKDPTQLFDFVKDKEWPFFNAISYLLATFSSEDLNFLKYFMLLPMVKTTILIMLERGIDFPFEVAAVRPWIELETGSAIFCKRGRETATTYCLPPWQFISRDNKIEMLDFKFGFWRECHIERPANIVVAEHAFINRVVSGMDGTWMTCNEYLKNPIQKHKNYDCYPVILGPLRGGGDYPNLAVLTSRIQTAELQAFDTLDTAGKEKFTSGMTDFKDMFKEINNLWTDGSPSYSTTLWNGDIIQNQNIPRIACLGTTRQMKTEIGANGKMLRHFFDDEKLIQNRGHLKSLDSIEKIGSLCGFAQSQVGTPDSFF
jgi:hypothetical protein